jgi:WD40 repeat protein
VGAHVRPALGFSRDGKKLVSSLGGATLRQFDVGTGREAPGPGNAHRAAVWSLALSADGKSLRTFGSGDAIRTWDWATGKETRREGLPASVTHAAFANSGHLAFAVGNEVTLRGKGGTKTWRIARREFPPLHALALSPDGELLATRSFDYPEVKLWSAGGKHLRTLGRPGDGPSFLADGTVEAAGVVTPDVVFSPDGRRLAGAGPRRQLCLWDMTTGNLLWELPPRAGQVVERFGFSPAGTVLATIQSDGTVTLYEAAGGARRAHFGAADRTNQRAYSAYNYYGKSRLSLATRRAPPVCLAFSPDGRYLATAQETPAIHLWDVFTGREVGRLNGHEGGVVSLLWDTTRFTDRPTSHAARLSEQALEALWADLAGNDAARAFAALRKLVASADQAVTLFERRVAPASAPAPKRLAGLLANLESGRFERRRQAQAELQALGELAEPALRKALADGPPLGLRQRRERLLALSATQPGPAQLRDLRAVEALEMIGSTAARRALARLAGGEPGARLTREARGAVQRLAKRAVRP